MAYNYPEPSVDEQAALAAFTARLTGHQIGHNHNAWIRDVLLVHGPGSEDALERGYRDGGWDNLFIRVVDVSTSSAAEGPGAVPDDEVAANDARRRLDFDDDHIGATLEPVAGASAIPSGDPPEFDLPNAPSALPGSDSLWDCYPGLLYGPNDRPRFDATSKLRWDDRASNPDRDDLRARHEESVRRAKG